MEHITQGDYKRVSGTRKNNIREYISFLWLLQSPTCWQQTTEISFFHTFGGPEPTASLTQGSIPFQPDEHVLS